MDLRTTADNLFLFCLVWQHQERCRQDWYSHQWCLQKLLGMNQMCGMIEMDNWATTPFGYCPSTAFLPVRSQCMIAMWNRCQEDLNSFPLGELAQRPRDALVLCGILDETIQYDLKSNNLSVKESIDGSESFTLETDDVYVWRYALLMVHGRNDDDDDLWFIWICFDILSWQLWHTFYTKTRQNMYDTKV